MQFFDCSSNDNNQDLAKHLSSQVGIDQGFANKFLYTQTSSTSIEQGCRLEEKLKAQKQICEMKQFLSTLNIQERQYTNTQQLIQNQQCQSLLQKRRLDQQSCTQIFQDDIKVEWCITENENIISFDNDDTTGLQAQSNNLTNLELLFKKRKIENELNLQKKKSNLCYYKCISRKNPFIKKSKISNKRNCQEYISLFGHQLFLDGFKCNENQVQIEDQKHPIYHQSSQQQSEIILNQHNIQCQYKGCYFVSLSKDEMDAHIDNIHNIQIYKCKNSPLCNFETKIQHCIIQHKNQCCFQNNDDYINKNDRWCTEQSNQSEQHIQKFYFRKVNDIYECNFKGCLFKTKNKRSCYSHRMNVHSTEMHYCDIGNCNFSTKSKKSFQHHKTNVHSTSIIKCDVDGCFFQAKNRVIINNHKKNIHEKQVRICDIQGCSFKSKNQRSLQNHRRNKHSIYSINTNYNYNYQN